MTSHYSEQPTSQRDVAQSLGERFCDTSIHSERDPLSINPPKKAAYK